jgi:PhnB protein
MSSVSTYLNFMGDTEEAIGFYASVFGTEIQGEIARMGDMGPDGQLTEDEKRLVAHVALPILGGHVLMASDMVRSLGHELRLSEGGSESTGMSDMPWAYWGCTLDRFGVRWMFTCYEQAQ